MINKIKSALRRKQLRVVKPFDCDESEDLVRFSICGYTESSANALADEFEKFRRVEIVLGDILNLDCDALVSPANSFGEMSGGLDKAIDDYYEGRAQGRAFNKIRDEFLGELPVGFGIVLNMSTERFPFLLLSPTMRIPGNVSESINAYLAMRALLVAIASHNSTGEAKIRTVAIPSLCTGVGGMSETESAKQMSEAFENVAMGAWQGIKHPAMAPYATK